MSAKSFRFGFLNRKIKNILLILVAIASLTLIGVTIFIGTVMGKRADTDLKNVIEIEKPQLDSKINLKLISFLENPIDWQYFKKNRHGDVTTSVTNGMEFYFHPKFNDSIFYSYNLVTPNIGERGVNDATVFKYGKNKHRYDDETEILIELRVLNQDADLGKANLVGLTKTELEVKLGSDYSTYANQIIYSNKNKVLIIELNNSKIKSYRYIKLNTEKIDSVLIQKITE